MKASVIVPILYAEPGLESLLGRLAPLRDRLDLEILLVVDVPDGAREPEAHKANDAVAATFDAATVYRVGERGFGSALRRGFAEATGDVVIPFMGDASDDPQDIPKLIEAIERGYDVVAGSRYMRGGGIIGNTPKQRISQAYSYVLRALAGMRIHDVSNAFKAYRRSVVESVSTVAESFDISVELTVKAARAGFRIGEIPTTWTNRKAGSSAFSLRNELPRYWRWLVFAAKRNAAAGRVASRRSV